VYVVVFVRVSGGLICLPAASSRYDKAKKKFRKQEDCRLHKTEPLYSPLLNYISTFLLFELYTSVFNHFPVTMNSTTATTTDPQLPSPPLLSPSVRIVIPSSFTTTMSTPSIVTPPATENSDAQQLLVLSSDSSPKQAEEDSLMVVEIPRDPDEEEEDDSMDSLTSQSSSNHLTTTNTEKLPSRSTAVVDKEKIGRWSEHEHVVFLDGLRSYGKQWKTIAGLIGTRTVVQVRTHAQKYFQKIERSSNKNGCTNMGTDVVVVATPAVVVDASTVTAVRSTSDHVPSVASPLKATTAITITKASSSTVQRPTPTKRKSLPTSLPSRKKPRKMAPRLSMSTQPPRGASVVVPVTTSLMETNTLEL
jgi:SHAQKYF class myb-like DNA-binding protein